MKKKAFYLSILRELQGPLQAYTNRFALDQLVPGVDNIRYDAYLGSGFKQIVESVIYWLIAGKVKTLGFDPVTPPNPHIEKEINAFKKSFAVIMRSAVNQAKLLREPQVVFLAQTAAAKMLLKEIHAQFDGLVDRYRQLIRKHEISETHDLGEVFKVKEDMAKVQQQRRSILLATYRELWKSIAETWKNDIAQSCIANFGHEASLPEEFFNNPMLFVNGATDDFFMIEEYLLLGHRFDDVLRYDSVLSLLKNFIAGSDMVEPLSAAYKVPLSQKDEEGEAAAVKGAEENFVHSEYNSIINMLCCTENIGNLFHYEQTKKQYRNAKKEKADAAECKRLKKIVTAQKKLLDNLYNECRKTGFFSVIAAYYEMQTLLSTYCPALLPSEVLTFLVSPGERKKIVVKLKRQRSLSGKRISVKPLSRLAASFKKSGRKKRRAYLLRFLQEFVYYHRDYCNLLLLKESFQWVNILEDEKTINLSRVNRTLYEFLDVKDQVPENRAIRNHVIVKTDLRGSTEITSGLTQKGLNPASYFSLNFFDPVNAILPEYGASKVFIEGDALILSIFEEENVPEDWYAVARACGLALKMLQIVQRYNAKNRKNGLPILEQGVGICYRDYAPAFLFDGDNRIMISSAINRADRLSSCAKSLRKQFAGKQDFFNLYVFSVVPSSRNSAAEVQYLRYNVNGIELDAGAFGKLQQEIDLQCLELPIPELKNKRVKIYTGFFPTHSGKYKRLIIRESRIPEIDPKTFRARRLMPETYYEVCTNGELYARVKKKLNSNI